MPDPMMNLSTAVQVVLDAAINVSESPDAEAIAAAVLLAVKDQAAPHRPIPQSSLEWGEYSMTEIIRERLTDIANELAAVRTEDMPEDDDDDHPSLTAADRNPNLK